MSIRNISPEEFERLQTKKTEDQTAEIFKETEDKPQKIETSTEDVVLKKKSSIFEPAPVKYKLITTNNVIKKNLTSNHEIFVRRMCGEEDIYLQNMMHTDNLFDITASMTKILEGCIKSDIDVRTLPIIEKIPLFLFILSISLEDNFDAAPIKNCKTCDDNTQVFLKFSDFEKNYMPENFEGYPAKLKINTYENSNIYVNIELPKIGSENMFIENSKDKKEYIEKLLQIITKIYGTKSDGTDIEKREWVDILNFLNIEDKENIKKIQDDWGNKYALSNEIEIINCTNPECCMIRGNKKAVFDTYELMRKFLLNMVKNDQLILRQQPVVNEK